MRISKKSDLNFAIRGEPPTTVALITPEQARNRVSLGFLFSGEDGFSVYKLKSTDDLPDFVEDRRWPRR